MCLVQMRKNATSADVSASWKVLITPFQIHVMLYKLIYLKTVMLCIHIQYTITYTINCQRNIKYSVIINNILQYLFAMLQKVQDPVAQSVVTQTVNPGRVREYYTFN